MKHYPALGWLAFVTLLVLMAGTRTLAQDDPPAAELDAYVRLPGGDVYHFDCLMVPETTPTPEVYTPIPTNTPRPTFTPSVTPTPPAPCWGTVITDNLNVRSGPGIQFPAQPERYMTGRRVDILGTARADSTGDWYLVDNVQGLYVFSSYVGIGNTAVCGLELDPITFRAGGEDG